MARQTSNGGGGRFAYDGLDRVLHEKARLGIMTALVTQPDGLKFGQLKELCALTDGNLSRHLDVLRQAGVIEIRKGAAEGRPVTVCRATADGRRRFAGYLQVLRQVVKDASGTRPRRRR